MPFGTKPNTPLLQHSESLPNMVSNSGFYRPLSYSTI